MRLFVPALLALLLVSCASGDRGERWSVEVLPGTLDAYAVTFAADGKTLFALANQNAQLHLVQFDLSAKDRAAKNLGEIRNVPGLNTYDARHIDLAARPGTDELWAFLAGTIVKFPKGSAAWQSYGNPVGTSGAAGGLAFTDGNTLIVTSIEGNTVRVAIQGDQLATPEALDAGKHFQVAVVDGQAWFGNDTTGPVTLDLKALENKWKTGAGLYAGPVAVAGDRALHLSEMGYCVRPRNKETGGVQPPPNGTDKPYGSSCGDVHFDLRGELPRAAMAPSGNAVALVSPRGVVLLEESAPPNRSEDAEGTWCTFAHAADVSTSVTIAQGVMTRTGLAKAHFDTNFESTVLRGAGDVRQVKHQGPKSDAASKVERSEFDYQVKRAGDTLMLAGPVWASQMKQLTTAGFFDQTGVYVKSADGGCP